MNAETLKALKGSITKWRRILAGRQRDHGGGDCPLCALYHYDGHAAFCGGCPIHAATGGHGCNHTPHRAWLNHYYDRHEKRGLYAHVVGKCRTCKKLAREQLEFLQSLLPGRKP